MKLFNFFLTIIFILLSFSYLYSQTIKIEAEGYSIIGENLNKSRENAIENAIINGIKKFLTNKAIQQNEQTINYIKNNSVTGYEILKESFEGNILKEKIVLILDENSLNDLLHKKFTSPINVGLIGYLNNIYNDSLSNFLKKLILNQFDYNFIFNILKNVDEENLKNNDISIVVDLTLKKIKKLISVNKTFYNLNGIIKIYEGDKIFDNLTIKKNLTLSNRDDYLKNLKFVENYLKKILPIVINKIDNSNKKFENSFIYLTLIKPSNFSTIKNLENILEEFNLNYSLVQIYNGNITFKVYGITEKEIISILKSNNFYSSFKISKKEE